MEGLIPMVFKAIKRNRIRRRYECLSAGAAETYNISDFYLNNSPAHVHMTHSAGKMEERYGHLRRHKSIGDFYGYSMSAPSHRENGGVGVGGGGGGGGASPPPMAKQLVRFRSHKMFSCVTGAS